MFNSDVTKQVQEVIFFLEKQWSLFISEVFFNEVPVECSISWEDLGFFQGLE